jgi:glucosyl-3-phosphoglycerate synthase
MPPAAASRPRTFHHSVFSAQAIAAAREEQGLGVSVCLPARECASTVGQIVAALDGLREAGAVDRIVVVDADSRDGTARVAIDAGAEVWQQAELLPSFGAVLGKGDAMWRALWRLDSELVCFVDADSEHFSAHFATGLLGPLVCEQDVQLVKAFYRRPLAGAGGEGGGRVNHLMARPALALLYPELREIRQPLAGEMAARKELLERLPFVTGYGIEIAMLIDAWRAVGLEGIAQVDLEEHHNRHQPLAALAPMAQTVLATVLDRARRDGRLSLGEDAGAAGGDAVGVGVGGVVAGSVPLERQPLASVRVA